MNQQSDVQTQVAPNPTRPTNEPPNLQMVLDLPLCLSVELGERTLTVQEVIGLSRGKVVELEKLAGDPLDILLNGRLIARGEAVVVNERFGVRILEIVSPAERIQRIR